MKQNPVKEQLRRDAQALRLAMASKGFRSQTELSFASGVPQSAISRALSATAKLSVNRIAKINRVLKAGPGRKAKKAQKSAGRGKA